MSDVPPKPKGPVPPIYLGLAVLFEWGMHHWLPVAHWLLWPWRWVGLLVMVIGVLLTVWGRMQFAKHKTAVIPFRKSDHLITTGPFAYVRNPLYCGMLLLLCGEALLFGSLGPFAGPLLFWLVIRNLYVLREEEWMRMQFGAVYDEYCARVNRWF